MTTDETLVRVVEIKKLVKGRKKRIGVLLSQVADLEREMAKITRAALEAFEVKK